MELAGDSANGLVLSAVKFTVGNDLPDSDPSKKRIVDLTKRFQAKYGHMPNQFAGPCYDAMMLAKIALEKTDGDKSKMPAAFEAIRNYNGVGGSLSFGPEQHTAVSKDDLVMVGYRNGGFYLVDYK
jgi:branched-chain amino acid transport system substrate-binding protein